MSTRGAGRHQPFATWIAAACSVAFIGTSNYCHWQPLTAPATCHQEPAPAPHPQTGGSISCCAAMQAVASSTLDPSLAHPAAALHVLALQSLPAASLLELSDAASRLNSLARAREPARPFYRTTFANHAPPVSLT